MSACVDIAPRNLRGSNLMRSRSVRQLLALGANLTETSAPSPIRWARSFTLEELDRVIAAAAQLRWASRWARRPSRVGLLELGLEQAAAAWALAFRMDLERTRAGAPMRRGDENFNEILRAAMAGAAPEWKGPPVMAKMILSLSDTRLLAAIGDGKKLGDHSKCLEFVELWCEFVEGALDFILRAVARSPQIFSPTFAGRRAYAVASDPIMNALYGGRAKRVAQLYGGGRVVNLRWLKNSALYGRLGARNPEIQSALGDPTIGRMLARTADELILAARNTRRVIFMFDNSRPGEIFSLDPRARLDAPP